MARRSDSEPAHVTTVRSTYASRHFQLTRFVCALALCLAACRNPNGLRLPDTSLARSSDGRVAFIRATPNRLVATSLGDEQATELWIANANGAHARRLLTGASADSVERTLAALSSPQFSLDGRQIYFLSRAWVTSDRFMRSMSPPGVNGSSRRAILSRSFRADRWPAVCSWTNTGIGPMAAAPTIGPGSSRATAKRSRLQRPTPTAAIAASQRG
jgi:hypothetical protein